MSDQNEVVKIKNELFEILNTTLATSVAKLQEREFPGKDGYWIGRFCERLDQLKKPYWDQRRKIAVRLAVEQGATRKEVEESGQMDLSAVLGKFQDELDLLKDEEIEVTGIYRRTLDLKAKGWPKNITPGEWRILRLLALNDLDAEMMGSEKKGSDE